MLITNLLAQIAFGLLAMTICLPSMQEWGAIFHADQAAVQRTFSACVGGLLQQLMGALGAYTVGLVPHHGSMNLAWLMMGFTLAAPGAQVALHRR